MGPLHSSHPNLSFQDVQQLNQTGRDEVTRNLSQNDATVVGDPRQHSVHFTEGAVVVVTINPTPSGTPRVTTDNSKNPSDYVDIDIGTEDEGC